MASKFLVPLHLANLTSTPPTNAATGFVKVYLLDNYLKYLSSTGTQTDVVLSRPLDGYAIAASASALSTTDTVINAFGKLQKSVSSLTLTGAVSGTAAYVSGNLTVNTTLNALTITLGADTTGDYVESISTSGGLTVTGGTGEGSDPVLQIKGVSNFVDKRFTYWDSTAAELKTGPFSTDGTNVTVLGNLTVSGATTTISSETLTIADNIILLNSNITAAPSENAGIEIQRGTSPNVSLRWNETTDKWQVTDDGTTFYDIATSNTAPNVTAGSGITVTTSGTTLTVSHTDTSTLASTSNVGSSYIQNVSVDTFGHLTGVTSTALKYTQAVGNGVGTSFNINHNKNETAVIIQVYETAAPYSQVDCEVTIFDANTITLNFAVVPTTNQYTAVVI